MTRPLIIIPRSMEAAFRAQLASAPAGSPLSSLAGAEVVFSDIATKAGIVPAPPPSHFFNAPCIPDGPEYRRDGFFACARLDFDIVPPPVCIRVPVSEPPPSRAEIRRRKRIRKRQKLVNRLGRLAFFHYRDRRLYVRLVRETRSIEKLRGDRVIWERSRKLLNQAKRLPLSSSLAPARAGTHGGGE